MKITEYKKKDGSIVYRSSIYLGTDTVTGKKVKTTISGRNKKELKAKALQAQIEFEKHGSTVFKAVQINTYAELVESWWDSYRHTVKPNTMVVYKGMLKNYLLPAFGSYKLDKLTPPIIQKVVNDWAQAYNSGYGYKNYSLLHSTNKRILQYGVVLQALPSNPARDTIVPRKAKNTPTKIKYLNDTDLKKFLDYLDGLDNTYKNFYDTVLYKTLLATGLRIGECLALKWSDIDLQDGTISVTKTLNLLGTLNSPKSKSAIRTLDLDKKTLLMLRLYKARQAENGRTIGISYQKVFPNSFDEYKKTNRLQYRLKEHLKKADCPSLGFHAFRHTHASILLNAGLGYKDIQTRLGHSKISMTMDIYSHLSETNQKKTASVFEMALEKLKSS